MTGNVMVGFADMTLFSYFPMISKLHTIFSKTQHTKTTALSPEHIICACDRLVKDPIYC